MATYAVRLEKTLVVREEKRDFWNKIKGFFSMLPIELQPYFGPMSLDYLDRKYLDGLSAGEQAKIKAEISGGW